MSNVRVYGAPWCPDCRRSKKFLTEHRVGYDWIDVDQDPTGLSAIEAIQGGGRTIPTIVFPDGTFLVEPTDSQLAAKLGLQMAPDRSVYDLVIIGGGPAGLTAAIYAAREGMAAIVIDSGGLGGQAATTERIDNYPGFPDGVGGAELAERLVAHARRYQVELLSATEVVNVTRDGTELKVSTGSGHDICGRAVIVATGSSYRRLNVPGEEQLIGVGVHFCATCDGPFYAGAEELLVVGGGNSALEEALFLTQFAERIRIVEFAPRLTASKLLQDKVNAHPQVIVHTNVQVTELRGQHRLQEVVAVDRDTGEAHCFRPSAAFVFIGLDPNTGFLRGALELDSWGFVQTDDRFQASIPGVFAAGDVRRGSTKQLGSAVGEGVTALLMVRHHLQSRGDLSRLDLGSERPAEQLPVAVTSSR